MKTKQLKPVIFAFLIVFYLVFMGSAGFVRAEDPPPENGEEVTNEDSSEVSAFQNPTQAQKAINAAQAWAAQEDNELADLLDKIDSAKKDLENARNQEPLDQDAIDAARALLDELMTNAKDRMAEVAGVKSNEIEGMREDGMGWGEIAHELGLHPGVLGQGHVKRHRFKNGWGTELGPGDAIFDDDIEEAIARDFTEGKAKGLAGFKNNSNKGNQGKSSGKKDTNSSKGKSKNGKKK